MRPSLCVTAWLSLLSINTPFFFPVLLSPSVAHIPRETCISPTQWNRKHLPQCEMWPYRIRAEVERILYEFRGVNKWLYTLITEITQPESVQFYWIPPIHLPVWYANCSLLCKVDGVMWHKYSGLKPSLLREASCTLSAWASTWCFIHHVHHTDTANLFIWLTTSCVSCICWWGSFIFISGINTKP